MKFQNTTLEIGKHFEISFNSGETFYDFWPKGNELKELQKEARAGDFYIRFKKPNLNKMYWIEYRPKRKQFLGKTKRVKLINGKVVFHRSLRNSYGNLHTIIVSRADSNNPYITPITQFYSLKVRENVT